MEERHLHFNVIQLLWLYLAIVLVSNFAKFVLNRWRVPGLTDLVNNT